MTLTLVSPQVRAVRLRRERIAVALEHKVYVYNFADLKLLHQTETLSNTAGLLALSHTPGPAVLACPGLHRGAVRLEWYDAGNAGAAGGAAARRTRFVAAHDGALAALALCADGSRLATASDKGTLVRVFDTATGAALAELRRGADRACIFSVSFSGAGSPAGGPPGWVAASSDKGTVHVWPLPPAGGTSEAAAAQPQTEAAGGGNGGGSGGGSGAASFVVRAMRCCDACVQADPLADPLTPLPFRIFAEGVPASILFLRVVARAVPPPRRLRRRRHCRRRRCCLSRLSCLRCIRRRAAQRGRLRR
jgi:hypothetical protein